MDAYPNHYAANQIRCYLTVLPPQMGVFEMEAFAKGTNDVALTLAGNPTP
jgi:3-phosphoglycerate kinase